MGIFRRKQLETPSKSPKSDPPERASGDGYPPGPQRHETVRSGPSSESSSPASSADRATVSHDCSNATVVPGLTSNPGSISTPDGQPGAQQRPSSQSCQTLLDPNTSSTSGTCNESSQPDNQTQQLFGGSLWEKAANSMDLEDRNKLNDLKSKRERQAVGSTPNGQGGTSTHGTDPSADVDIVLRKVKDVKEKDNEGTWRPVLEKITKGVLAFKSLGDAAVKFDKSGYAALGWSVVSFGLEVAARNDEARNFALSSSEFVPEFMTRYALYEKLFRGAEPDEEFDRRLVEVYKAILRYVIALDKYLWQYGPGHLGRAVLELRDRSISQRKDEIDDADTKAKDWLPIVTFKSNKDDFAKLLEAFKAQILPEPSHPSRRECLNSLAFREMDDRFNDIDAAAKGTCEWFPLREEYRDWVKCDRGLLWIKGKPGSGKSTLLRFALDNIMVASKIGTNAIVLSFFFHGRGVELQRTPLGLFRSLLHQLLSQIPDKLIDLVDAFNKHENSVKPGEKWHWHLGELRSLFKLSLTKALENQPVWLFVDALDESGKANAVELVRQLNSLRQTLQSTGLLFRICFTCRHYPVLDQDVGQDRVFKICPSEKNGADISTYVQTRLSTSDTLMASTIPALITERAHGVFMWARLVVDKVLDLDNRGVGLAKIKKEVYSIHPGLDQLYHELIQGMNERPASLKLVQWICFATRPLTLDELRWAMVIDVDCSYKRLQECQSAEDYASDAGIMERRLKDLSCGLAEAVPSSNAKVVQFIHQSVKDFFVDKGLSALDGSNKWVAQFIRQSARDIHKSVKRTFVEKGLSALDGSPNTCLSTTLIALATVLVYLDYFTRGPRSLLPDHAFPLPVVVAVISAFWLHDESVRSAKSDFAVGTAHYRLSRTCIRYLAMEEIGRLTTRDRNGLKSEFPLLHYATTSWVVHVQQSQEKEISQGDLPNYFAWPSEALTQLWVQTYRTIEPYTTDCPPQGTSMVHVASRYQLLGPLQVILQEADQVNVDINAKDKSGRTPLLCAAMNGHEAVVQLLLDKGAAIEAKDYSGRTPLSCAAESGHEAVMQLLLDKGAAIEVKDRFSQTPLLCAAGSGREAVVQLLLDKGAAVEVKDYSGRTPLSCAAESGHEAVMQLLLDKGAAIEAKDRSSRTPLLCAAGSGREAVVQLLLNKGANIETKDKAGRTPLSCATENGRGAIVQLLLDKGANIEMKNYSSWTPLLCAAWSGHEAIVQLLLNKGANIETKDKAGRTPLLCAAENGRGAVVQLLLDKGADIEAKDEAGRTPLSCARGAVVQLLQIHSNSSAVSK